MISSKKSEKSVSSLIFNFPMRRVYLKRQGCSLKSAMILVDNKSNSIDIIVIKIFFLFKTIPNRPIKKTIQVKFNMKFMLTVNIFYF